MMRYAVLKFEDCWRVQSERRRIGHFEKRDEALSVGVHLAHEASCSGYTVELLVQDEVGRMTPFPPYCGTEAPFTDADASGPSSLSVAPSLPG